MNHVLSTLQDKLNPAFWPVFFATAIALVVVAVRSQAKFRNNGGLVLRGWAPVATLAVSLPLLIVVLAGAAFAYHDDDVILENTVAGRRLARAIWPDQGRYFPLFSQEFNVLKYISATPGVYYGFIAVQLVVMCFVLNLALSKIAVGWRVLATALVLYASGIAIVFVEAIYPERNIVVLLVIMLVAMQRFDEHPSRLNMIVALLAAHTAMYFKEPVFLLVAVVAVCRLAFFMRQSGRAWQRRDVLKHPLEVALLGACLVFAVQIGILLAGPGDGAYVRDATIGPFAAFTRYLRMDPLFVAFLVCSVIRLIRWRRDRQLDAIWDPFALGAFVYFATLVASGLAADRYMGPVELIGALFAVREVSMLWSARPAARSWVSSIAILVAVVTVGSGSFRIVEHTSVVSGTEQLADFVASYSAENDGPVRLYFPDAQEFRIMNFVSYLNYSHSDEVKNIQFAGPHEFPGLRCVFWLPYRCESATSPRSGDLIVHLPDDTTRSDDPGSRESLFEYSWLGRDIPNVLGKAFYVEAPLYTAGDTMPPDWLTTSVERQL